ncbi:hypothetical protein V1514DRAFT_368631 [Lipomyces japonicus]|uniref:uncharacterized protein n=1 Tax=Lipomyces japonicus TaxID=56871 RepID=UPI0034CE9823
MADGPLLQIYQKIVSDKVKDRTDGLNSLSYLIADPYTASQINDKGIHKLCESIFLAVVKEKNLYIKAANRSKATIHERLNLASSVLRQLVENRVSKFRLKTVIALFNHITQILPDHQNRLFFEPIGLNYIKVFKILCSYTSHVEHLTAKDWKAYAEFCCDFSLNFIEDSQNNETHSRRLKYEITELILCLEQLVYASNAPLLSSCEIIFDTVFEFLDFQKSESISHLPIFSIVNKLLSTTMINQLQNFAVRALPLYQWITKLWATKNNTLKEQFLITLLQLFPEVPNFNSKELDEELINMVHAIITDYCGRQLREILQVEDITLSRVPTLKYLTTRDFHLSNDRGLTSWLTLWVLSLYIVRSDVSLRSLPHILNFPEDNSEPAKKRRRLSRMDTSLSDSNTQNEQYVFEPIVNGLAFLPPLQQIQILQILAFAFSPISSTRERPYIVKQLSTFISAENNSVASWAMITLGTLVYRDGELKNEWMEIWDATYRRIATLGTCSASCYLLDRLLTYEAVPFDKVSLTIESTLKSLDNIGPAVLTESSINFVVTILQLQTQSFSIKDNSNAVNVVNWTFARFEEATIRQDGPGKQCSLFEIARFLRFLTGRNSDTSHYDSNKLQVKIDSSAIIHFLFKLDLQIDIMQYLTVDTNGMVHTHDMFQNFDLSSKTMHPIFSISNRIDTLVCKSFFEILQTYSTIIESDTRNTDKLQKSFDVILIAILGFYDITTKSDLAPFSNIPISKLLNFVEQQIMTFLTKTETLDLFLLKLHTIANMDIFWNAIKDSRNFQLINMLNSLCTVLESIFYPFYKGDQKTRPKTTDLEFDNLDNSNNRTTVECDAIPRHWFIYEYSAIKLQHEALSNLRMRLLSVESSEPEEELLVKFLTMPIGVFFLNLDVMERLSHEFAKRSLKNHAHTMLQIMGKRLLSSYDFERSEITIIICIKILRNIVNMWARDDGSDLCIFADNIYSWLVQVSVTNRTTSSLVRYHIPDLLLQILNCNIAFGNDGNVPSPRTLLFGLLKDEDSLVTIHMAHYMSELFKLYSYSSHNSIYNDIHGNLTLNPDLIESMAARALTLAVLSSKSSVILANVVYNLAELSVALSDTRYVAYCFALASKAQGLNSRELFEQYSSLVVHQAMVHDIDLSSAVFTNFGYVTEKDFYIDNMEIYLSLSIYNKGEKELGKLIKFYENFGLKSRDIAIRCIARIVAFGSIKMAQNEIQGKELNNSLSKWLGQAKKDLIFNRYSTIVAIIIDSINLHEDKLEFLENKEIESIFQKLDSNGNLDAKLIIGTGPSFTLEIGFKAFDKINDFMERTVSSSSIGLANFVYISRTILDRIKACTQPLQICMVLKTLKLHIAMNPSHATNGYSAKMILQCIVPLLAKPECAIDTISIVKYLLYSDSIMSSPQLYVQFLASISYFLNKLENSHGKKYRKSIQLFRYFVVSILRSFGNTHSHIKDNYNFLLTVLFTSSDSRIAACSDEILVEEWNKESILQVILNPQNSFDKIGRKYILLLIGDFLEEKPKAIFLDDEGLCRKLAPKLLKICGELDMRLGFTSWAGKVCGIAYSSSGYIDKNIYDNLDLSVPKQQNIPLNQRAAASLLSLIIDLLDSEVQYEVAVAERCLRRFIKNYKSIQWPFPESIMPFELVKFFSFEGFDAFWKSEALIEPSWKGDTAFIASISLKLSLALSKESPGFYSIISVLIKSIERFGENALSYLMLQFAIVQSYSSDVTEIFNEIFRSDCNVYRKSLFLRTFIYLQYHNHQDKEQDELKRFTYIEGLDYQAMLSSAIECGMHSSALLITEQMWSIGTDIGKLNPTLHTIYKNIDDPDAFYAVKLAPRLETLAEISEFQKDGWKSLAYYCALMDNDRTSVLNTQYSVGILEAFSSVGLDSLSLGLRSSIPNLGTEKAYEVAWKLERWDLPILKDPETHDGVIYSTLQRLHTSAVSETSLLQDFMSRMVGNITKDFSTVNDIRNSFKTLAILTEVWEMLELKEKDDIYNIINKFKSRSIWSTQSRFSDFEDIFLSRQIVMSALSNSNNAPHLLHANNTVKAAEALLLKHLVSAARKHGELQKALKYFVKLDRLASTAPEYLRNAMAAATSFEAANVFWARKEASVAIPMLQKHLTDNRRPQSHPVILQGLEVSTSFVYATLGQWIASERQERPDSILLKYLEPAIDKFQNNIPLEEQSHIFHIFAEFCDYQLRNRENIDEFERIEILKTDWQTEMEELSEHQKRASISERKQYANPLNKVTKLFNYAASRYEVLMNARRKYLENSIIYYLRSMAVSDSYDENSFRFCSLWLSNSEDPLSSEAAAKVFSEVPTAKFVGLINQLFSRLLLEESSFQNSLKGLVEKLCRDFPFHCLYQLYALRIANMNKAADVNAESRSQSSTNIWNKLKSTSEFNKSYLKPIELFCEKSVKLAQYKVKGKKVTLDQLPDRSFWHSKLTVLDIPLPTAHISIEDAKTNYVRVPRMLSANREIAIASGLSMPKICNFITSDGQSSKLLFKGGNDDMRQDAVMEQVFEQVNYFLQKNETTKQRNLRVRTYKVIPLSSQAGIIEFVQGTIALQDILAPLHKNYYPDDWDALKCRELMKQAQGDADWQRLDTYLEITRHMHPVLRYFFVENFRSPRDWLEKKIAYTRSTATISILGAVLGLGDRHCNNILIDATSGEPVHIDLGVAFEQGKILTVPELVPFRLSRDIVDGMGVSGVEGIFRRCCGFTLSLLRQESRNIMTILDVLKFDPLYSWTISPLRRRRMQNNDSPSVINDMTRSKRNSEGNEAEKALAVVSNKLSNNLSVEAVVNQWIQEASDPRFLSVLFCGWSPFF